MGRFVLPAFSGMTVGLMMLFAGALVDAPSLHNLSAKANDIAGEAARHTSPPLSAPSNTANSPSASGVAEQHKQKGPNGAPDRRTSDLQRQVSELQGLVAQFEQELARRRKPQRPSASDIGGQPAGLDAGAADLRRQDIELRNDLHSLLAQLEHQQQLEVESSPTADPAEQHEWQAAHDALKHAIDDLN